MKEGEKGNKAEERAKRKGEQKRNYSDRKGVPSIVPQNIKHLRKNTKIQQSNQLGKPSSKQ